MPRKNPARRSGLKSLADSVREEGQRALLQKRAILAILSAKDAAASAGLFATLHALDAASNLVGWEIAGTPEKSRYRVVDRERPMPGKLAALRPPRSLDG